MPCPSPAVQTIAPVSARTSPSSAWHYPTWTKSWPSSQRTAPASKHYECLVTLFYKNLLDLPLTLLCHPLLPLEQGSITWHAQSAFLQCWYFVPGCIRGHFITLFINIAAEDDSEVSIVRSLSNLFSSESKLAVSDRMFSWCFLLTAPATKCVPSFSFQK